MTLMLELLAASLLLELALPLSRRRWLSLTLIGAAVGALGASSGVLVVALPGFGAWFIISLSLCRLVNLLRAAKQVAAPATPPALPAAAAGASNNPSPHQGHLRNIVWTTSWQCGLLQVAALAVWAACARLGVPADIGWWALAAGVLAAGVVMVATLWRRAAAADAGNRQRQIRHFADQQLPTLSVLIPARNETSDLIACLDSLVRSNYPKLEIMVLDDSSSSPRTPEIIRGYAQAGVRFLPGEKPRPDWLAKNQAYERLADSASGDILLFCGVDIRFEPSSLRRLVEYMLQTDMTMMSLLPLNDAAAPMPLFQPMRYMRELSTPRRWLGRPPVLSSCWLGRRQLLTSTGGMNAVSRMIIPEGYFARQAEPGSYSLLAGNGYFGLSSHKPAAEQCATAVRTHYPELHRRPLLVWLWGCGTAALVWWPWAALLAGIDDALPVRLAAGLSLGLMTTAYGRTLRLAYGRVKPLHLLVWPLAATIDFALMVYSMLQYEFGHVMWKGRDVTGTVIAHSSRPER